MREYSPKNIFPSADGRFSPQTELSTADREMLDISAKAAVEPNVSLLSFAARKFIRSNLEERGFSNREGPLQWREDAYGIYVRMHQGEEPPFKLKIEMHLDHPGVIFDGKGNGQLIGSVGEERLQSHIEKTGPLPVKTFTWDGQRLGTNQITHVDTSKRKVKTAHKKKEEKNAHAIWDISEFSYDPQTGIVGMINADDMVHAAIIMQTLDLLKDASFPYDVEFIFTAVEEVRQAAATGIAKRGKTPFGRLDHSTYFLALEAGIAETPEELLPIVESMGLTTLSYEGGITIGINDGGVVYGSRFSEPNGMESILLHVLEENNLLYQHTIDGGACDAISWSEFVNTPNIASLTIPARYKHNWGTDGEIVLEELSLKDMQTTRSVLFEVIKMLGKQKLPELHPHCLSQKLKTVTLPGSSSVRSDLLRALVRTQHQMRRDKFFPENLQDLTAHSLGALASKLIR